MYGTAQLDRSGTNQLYFGQLVWDLFYFKQNVLYLERDWPKCNQWRLTSLITLRLPRAVHWAFPTLKAQFVFSFGLYGLS
jgi:hypothetical protein